MKSLHKAMAFIVVLSFFTTIKAQKVAQSYVSNFNALESGNFNPALYASNNMQYHIGFAGFYSNIANNYLEVSIKNIANFDRYRDLIEDLNGKDKFVHLENEISGPGAMFRINDKNAFSIATKARMILSVSDFQEDFATSLYNHAEDVLLWLPNFDDFRATIGLNAYHEIKLGYARQLFSNDNHALYAGGSLKLLTNIAAGSFNSDNVSFKKIAQSLTDTVINLGQSSFDLYVSDNYDSDKFKYKFGIDGIGTDLGVVYEYKRSAADNYFIKSGISINDLGSTSYTISQKYSRQFVSHGRDVPIQNFVLAGDSLKIDDALDSLGFKTIPSGKKTMRLPSTINAFIDVNVILKFYASVAVQFDLNNYSKGYGKANMPSTIMITPRFETKIFSVMLPTNYNKYAGFNSGISLRVGQFGIGSADLFTTLLRKKTKSVNIYFSTGFGKKRKNKSE